MTTRVKICCIKSREEARLALRYGASALGFVSTMPSGPGPISENQIAAIIPFIPSGIATFLLTSQRDDAAIIKQQQKTKANTLQLVNTVPLSVYPALRAALPGITVVQVIHVTGQESVEEANVVAPFVDAILLDSGNPKLPVKELGGTGRVHDWKLSRAIREQVTVPVYLAGGLRPENVAEAIRFVRPYAVDLCSGVRTNGSLDEAKLAAFFSQVSAAHS
ncbi:MAG: phosphoribosylanthranilate isomerase [Ignavibacteriales bacterium]|nr:phosphoribosylanthranilate isomerase [Ignavibacteriales bacterium]